MDFDKLQRKNAKDREHYKPKSMQTGSENEFVFGIFFVFGFIMLFAVYSLNRESISDFFDKGVEQVGKVTGSNDYQKEEQIRKEKQRSEYLKSKNNPNANKSSDGYDIINFVNNSNEKRKIYWVDRHGNKKLYKTLKPKESYEQRSYAHHQWLVTDPNDNELGKYYTKGSKSDVTMYDSNIAQTTDEPETSVQSAVDEDLNARSIEAKKASTINFINSSNDIRKIYWLDYKGKKVLYRVLKPGDTYTQRTFITHPWLVTDGQENKLGIYYPADTKKDVVLENR
ncbi:MAG: hypothetical protein COV35_01330 [Alphaproteobacteria bacterium CG11_big_fil_rev_8_21_14_0_20_39_49]|nr:MAG: hypothetical protein COV35_01330 [Alphaproteobacteria bacterium CG11_big_fil_rev_8_21_14_0_20_39_49]